MQRPQNPRSTGRTSYYSTVFEKIPALRHIFYQQRQILQSAKKFNQAQCRRSGNRGRRAPFCVIWFLLKSFRFSGAKLQGNDFCSGKWDFPPQKSPRAHRTRRRARLKLERASTLSSSLGFFDRLMRRGRRRISHNIDLYRYAYQNFAAQLPGLLSAMTRPFFTESSTQALRLSAS